MNRWRNVTDHALPAASAVVLAVVFAACATHRATVMATPAPSAETRPVPHDDDAADDPAIWVHPEKPELSLVVGTDKQGALHVYTLDGGEMAVLGAGTKPNNVEVIQGVMFGGSRKDLIVASTRADKHKGIHVWTIDPATRRFTHLTSGGPLKAFDGDEPYGCCGFRSIKTGEANVFVTAKDGRVAQFALRSTQNGGVQAERLRVLKFGSTVEGCVVDEEFGVAYMGEETRGIWKVSAEPGSREKRILIAASGDHGLKTDVEGLAIYDAPRGRGYLVASSQGNNTFKVYERGGSNRYVGTIDPSAGRFGDVEDTDGIAVTSANLGPLFPKGLFVAQDGKNGNLNQNFKFYRWEDVAGTNLIVETRPLR